MDEVKLMQVIYCTKERRGDGKSDISPVRAITEVFTTDGELIAEKDPCGGYSREDMISFALHYKSGVSSAVPGQALKEWESCPK